MREEKREGVSERRRKGGKEGGSEGDPERGKKESKGVRE